MNTPTPYDDDFGDLDGHEVDAVMMELLRNHVPLTLLMDLAYPEGPNSSEILATETA